MICKKCKDIKHGYQLTVDITTEPPNIGSSIVVKRSDYMGENLKEKYLKNGVVVELRDGSRGLVVNNKILGNTWFEFTGHFTENLECFNFGRAEECDIMKVLCGANTLNLFNANITMWSREEYEKPQVKEYTMEELNKKLGETIKIVDKH